MVVENERGERADVGDIEASANAGEVSESGEGLLGKVCMVEMVGGLCRSKLRWERLG